MGVTAVVLDIILPVFGVLGLGYLAARRGWFDAEANRGLSLYVFRVAIPLMLFRCKGHRYNFLYLRIEVTGNETQPPRTPNWTCYGGGQVNGGRGGEA